MSGLTALNALGNLERLSVSQVREDGGGFDLSGLTHLRRLTIGTWRESRRVRNTFVTEEDKFGEQDLASLSYLTNLEELHLVGSGIGDDGLAHLAGLTGLRRLYVGGGSDLTDIGLVHLAGLRRLESLDIRDSRITADGLALLYPLKTLQVVQVRSVVSIGRQTIANLSAALPHLQSLRVSQPDPTRWSVPVPPRVMGPTRRSRTEPTRQTTRSRRRR